MGGSGGRARRLAAAACVVGGLMVGTAGAQSGGDPNPGAMTLTTTMDASNAYLFRGIPQDDTGLILWPAADLSVALRSGGGTFRSITVGVGTWNSLHTGVTGTDGPSGKLWYESDFSASAGLGFGGGVTFVDGLHRLHEPERRVRDREGALDEGGCSECVACGRMRSWRSSWRGRPTAAWSRGGTWSSGPRPV